MTIENREFYEFYNYIFENNNNISYNYNLFINCIFSKIMSPASAELSVLPIYGDKKASGI